MDSNEKRERNQKMRHDKRSKDHKRGSSSKMGGGTSSRFSPATKARPNEQEEDPSAEEDELNGDQPSKTYAKRKLVSNWSKYDTTLPLGDVGREVSTAADFESLMRAQLCEGGHFQFKSERSWKDNSPSERSNLFSLDLNKLSTALGSIPFYDQINLSKELFSEEELTQMDNEADKNLIEYTKMLSMRPNANNAVNETKSKANDPEQYSNTSKSANELIFGETMKQERSLAPTSGLVTSEPTLGGNSPIAENDDELDFLLSLKDPVGNINQESSQIHPSSTVNTDELCADLNSVRLANPASTSTDKKEDLEDWLDSILDD